MHFPHGDNASEKILPLAGIGLMDNALVSVPGSAGFVCVDSGDQDQPVLHFVVDFGKTLHVFADGILVVCGTGTDDDQKFIALPGDHGADLGIPYALSFYQPGGEGVLFPDFIGGWK